MSEMSELLVSRPHFDSRYVAQEGQPLKDPEATVKEDFYPSSGLATAGFRSAKYTTEEWHSNNYSILHQAVNDRNHAEKICLESKAFSSAAEAESLRAQSEGTRHLGERLQDIHFWKSELQRHIEELVAETDLLLGLKRRLEKALDTTEIPFAIATDNLSCRERRLGPDLVKDRVEEELIKEVDLIKSIQSLLKRTHSQVVSQIKSNREAKQTLELDWSDKEQAYSLDEQCGRLNNMSSHTQYHASSAAAQDQVSNGKAWVSSTRAGVAGALREERASAELRGLGGRVLLDTAEDLRAQSSCVERAFSHRCQEISLAHSQLETHLGEVLQQVGAQERSVLSLQQSLQNTQPPLRVAQTRLHLRSFRPHMELCRDPPQLSLVEEEAQIRARRDSLQQQLSGARASLASLEQSRMALEKDLGCKRHSLLIDLHKCLAHRARYPSVTALSGH
ncbi:tektin-4 [Osmerus eperlanus]|uniref:tektin-4 n=1 Tax=Osmerus eperlanus TaxID=29151 RepID=UPI002E16220B